jgi:hypothetical protein
MSVASKQLVPNNETYLCSIQGTGCGTWTLRRDISSMGKGCQAAKYI